jgi:hypothetical protein
MRSKLVEFLNLQ